eukprot:CAMPEP_0196582766 /NCGR_PEP_ID=MMETSP1081-20130531/40559_1 /TAXON_ID=36882 /ORGANISM="Pyramimonas amylifera, Strain CCMP720" /LENGTH=608 /DNA_ID=CAMNT_0041903441 /DNA_START=233 /DNA_END=2059 /DNA_ORIENTATION=+
MEGLNWLEKTVNELWPFLSDAINAMGKQMVEDQMKSNPALKNVKLELEEFSLGNKAPTFAISIVDDTDKNRTRLDLKFNWSGEPEIIIKAKAVMIPVSASLKNFRMAGTLRVLLAFKTVFDEATGSMRMMAATTITLKEKPVITFDIKLIGMGTDIGDKKISDTVKNVIAGIMVWPNQMLIPLTGGQKSDFPEMLVTPLGMLYIRLEKAVLPRGNDTSGKNDPYVILKMQGNEDKKTKQQKSTNAPFWNESDSKGLEFVIKNPSLQTLHLKVMDWDLAGKDDFIAECRVPLPALLNPDDDIFKPKKWEVPMKAYSLKSRGLTHKGFDKGARSTSEVLYNIVFSALFLPFHTNSEAKKVEPSEETRVASTPEVTEEGRQVVLPPKYRAVKHTTFLMVILHNCSHIPAMAVKDENGMWVVKSVQMKVSLVLKPEFAAEFKTKAKEHPEEIFPKDFPEEVSGSRSKPVISEVSREAGEEQVAEKKTETFSEDVTEDAGDMTGKKEENTKTEKKLAPAWFPEWEQEFTFVGLNPEHYNLEMSLMIPDENKSLGKIKEDVAMLSRMPMKKYSRHLENGDYAEPPYNEGANIEFTIQWGDVIPPVSHIASLEMM